MISGDIKQLLLNAQQLPIKQYTKIRILEKDWGKNGNLILKAELLDADLEFCFSVWFNNCYKPRDLKVSFKPEQSIGKIFQVMFDKTKKGYIDIKEAVPLQYSDEQIEEISIDDILYGVWDFIEADGSVEKVYHMEVDEIFHRGMSVEDIMEIMGGGEEYAKKIFDLLKVNNKIYDCHEAEGYICKSSKENSLSRIGFEYLLDEKLKEIEVGV